VLHQVGDLFELKWGINW